MVGHGLRHALCLGLVAIAVMLARSPVARAEPSTEVVSLLPLDADAKLEIYGQPIASEIARALVAGGIDVVVVGPKMAVPERAVLVVDGTILSKGDTVVVSVRVRDRHAGTTLETLTATAATLTNIDKAAADLSGRVLPAITTHLASLRTKTAPRGDPGHRAPPIAPPPIGEVPRPVLIAVSRPSVRVGDSDAEPLRGALATAVETWARAHHREPKPVDPSGLDAKFAAHTVARAGADLAIAFDVVALTIEPGPIPTARARVRLRIADAGHVAFDRVIVTDTVVGDRGQPRDTLVQRVAREIVAIAQPNVRRAIATWK